MVTKTQLYNSILTSISSSYVFFAINFIGQIILARLLLPEHFGVVATVLAIMGIIDLFVGFSIPMAFIQAKNVYICKSVS